jgi:hypothetical protein
VGGAQVLRRPRHELTERVGGMQRPVRIAQQLAREEHHVGLACADDGIGLSGFVISPTAPVATPASRRMRSGERHLIPGPTAIC